MKGVAYPAINDGDFFQGHFPLPPLPEQHRIVAKIDQLMSLCDKLEAERNERNNKRLKIHTSAINGLLSASDNSSFDKSWNFITKNFSELYSVPENVEELKKAILQLAVMGKLVKQDPKDQPAKELLKGIEEEKMRLVKEGKIRNQEPLEKTGIDSILSVLPYGWSYACLLDLGFFLGGKTPSTNKAVFWNGSIPWVSAKDMKSAVIRDSQDHITQAGVESGLTIVPKKSVLMVVRSGILRRTFPVAINAVSCTINQDLKALVPFPSVYPEYVLLMLQGFETFILSKLAKAGMTVESIMFPEFVSHRFPLPPLPEQHRIVAKINQLMSLCNTLEQTINQSNSQAERLFEAVLSDTLSAS
jgi:type I restriction enzyme, S subunit